MAVPWYVWELCRELRRRQTPAEEILWQCLRDRRLDGYKFRRQHPLGRCIADFYCREAKLVIELDGPVHDQPDQRDYDQVREQELKARGLRVLRFKNGEVEKNLAGVLQEISRVLRLSQENVDG